MNALRSLLYALVFYPGSVVVVLWAAALTAFRGRQGAITGAYGWARFHAWCARWLLGVEVRIEGVKPAAPALYAFKHESMFETTEILHHLHDPVVVFKRELLDIPFWGWIARTHGVIAVDREAGAGALRHLLAEAKRVRAEGRSVVIFPEGSRIAHGERPALRAGFAGLYKALGLPVVPVAVDSGRLWRRRGFVKRAGVVTFRYLDPLPPGLPRDEIEMRVREAINTLNQ